MARGESAHELHFPISVLTPTSRFSENEDALHVAGDRSVLATKFGRQRMAVCDESGLVAIANGRVVELYQADAIQAPACQTASDSSYSLQATTRPLHLPSAGHIVLSDVIYGVEDSPTYATSVYFPTPDVLFVASTTLRGTDNHETAEPASPSTRLSGFRLYSRHSRASSHRTTSLRAQEPLLIIPLFSDAFAGVAPITTMEPIPRSSFREPDSGAVIVLFEPSQETPIRASSLGVFQWSERYSDRELSLAMPLQATLGTLTTVAVSEDAQWIVVGGSAGDVIVLDFRRVVWDPEMPNENQVPLGSQGGHRLSLGPRFRLGHPVFHAAASQHPLDHVRVACQALVGAANSFASALRWWSAQLSESTSRTVRYLLAGQQDGALAVMKLVNVKGDRGTSVALKTMEIYPALRALKNDAVVSISEPTTLSHSYTFSVVSTSSWRQWTIKQTDQERSGQRRLTWPTLVESLGLPMCQFQPQDIYGFATLSAGDRIAMRLTAIIKEKSVASRRLQWTVRLGRDGIRATATCDPSEAVELSGPANNQQMKRKDVPLERPPHELTGLCELEDEPLRSATTVFNEKKEVDANPSRVLSKNAALPAPAVARERDVAWRGRGDHSRSEEKRTETSPANPYELPPMAASTSPRTVASRADEPPHPLTKDEYNKRLAVMAQRVETMSTGLQSLRHSFKLFTDDVKEHMAFTSMQLEQLHDPEEDQQQRSV